jgi:hypothetical protein
MRNQTQQYVYKVISSSPKVTDLHHGGSNYTPEKSNIVHSKMFLKKQNIISVICQVRIRRKACNMHF